MTKIKCLGIACSPREKGNTFLLLEKALEGAASGGASTELLRLKDYPMLPCQACDNCSKTGQCVIQDGAGEIFEKVLQADRIILAAPIFSMGINAQAKTFIDRSQRFWACHYVLHKPIIQDMALRPPRKGIYIAAAGTGFSNVFDGALQVAKYFFKMLEISWLGSYCYSRIDKTGDILKNPQALAEVYQAGKMLTISQETPYNPKP